MPEIDKKTLEHLANLARIELDPASEETFAGQLGGILNHFKELQELPPRGHEQLRGKKVPLREDADTLPDHFDGQHRLIEAFPEKENGYLKIPPIFE